MGRIRRGLFCWAVAGSVLASVGWVRPAEATEGCPDPRTCPRYVIPFADPEWPTGPDGLVHIPYWVNPSQPWIDEDEAIGAINAAFQTWQSVVPALRFEFLGRTVRAPVPADGHSVVGWMPLDPLAHATAIGAGGGRQADILLNVYRQWAVYPCAQRDGSCTPRAHDFLAEWSLTEPYWPPGTGPPFTVLDVQNIVTHEIGHWLGLGDLYEEETSELTMHGLADDLFFDETTERKKVTLGLGDVLGVRSLYSCGCPLPVIYAP